MYAWLIAKLFFCRRFFSVGLSIEWSKWRTSDKNGKWTDASDRKVTKIWRHWVKRTYTNYQPKNISSVKKFEKCRIKCAHTNYVSKYTIKVNSWNMEYICERWCRACKTKTKVKINTQSCLQSIRARDRWRGQQRKSHVKTIKCVHAPVL